MRALRRFESASLSHWNFDFREDRYRERNGCMHQLVSDPNVCRLIIIYVQIPFGGQNSIMVVVGGFHDYYYSVRSIRTASNRDGGGGGLANAPVCVVNML